MLLAAGVINFDFRSSSAAVRTPLFRERDRRVKRTSVGMAAREDVRVKILELGGRKVLMRKRKEAKNRILRDSWADGGRGRGGGE